MIAVTGATGQLGRRVIDALLEQDVEPTGIVAAVRSPEKAADLAERGIEVREADYDRPDTLRAALEDVDRLLLISSSQVGQRVAQHRNVVQAAEESGVGFLAYTSIVRADTSPMQLAVEHRETESLIRESDLAFTFLRNAWYIENYTSTIDRTVELGVLLGSAGDGRISAATRDDYGAAAASVLTGEGHEGAAYELGGDQSFTMGELAHEISRHSGADVVYRDLPVDEYAKALIDADLPEGYAAILADSDRAVAEGHLLVESGDLRRLTGRPTTRLADVVSHALSG